MCDFDAREDIFLFAVEGEDIIAAFDCLVVVGFEPVVESASFIFLND